MVTIKNTKKIHSQSKHTLMKKNCDKNIFYVYLPVSVVELFMVKGLLLTPEEKSSSGPR